MWIVYALLAAVFAATTSILSKIGLSGVNSNVAVAIRTTVVLVMAWTMVFITGTAKELPQVSGRSFLFLGLSGISTGVSWYFFFRALSIGDASRVAGIDKFSVVITMVLAYFFLGEVLSLKAIIGGVLITVGTILLVF